MPISELSASIEVSKIARFFDKGMQTSRIGICVWMLWLFAAQCLAGETATAVATVTAGFVTGITVTSGGAGYTSEPAVTITGGGVRIPTKSDT